MSQVSGGVVCDMWRGVDEVWGSVAWELLCRVGV